MKRFYSIIAIVAVSLALTGCATQTSQPTTQPTLTPVQQAYLAANESAQLAASTLSALHDSGFISDSDYTNLAQPALATLNVALDAWGAHLNDSQTAQAQATFQAALPGVLQLIAKVEAQKKAAKAKPTTKPVSRSGEVIGGGVAMAEPRFELAPLREWRRQ